MNQLTYADFNVPGLCANRRAALRALVGDGPFEPREAAVAYLAAGYPWTDIPRAYAALVRAGRLPKSGLIWRIARLAFREAGRIRGLRHLSQYADTLDARTWREAKGAADAAWAAADADTVFGAASACADAAAYAAALDGAPDADAAYICADADAAYYVAYYAAYAAALAATADERVSEEVVELVLGAVEAAPGE